MITKLKQWFFGLAPRERALVAAAAATVVVALLFLLVWEPLHDGVKRLIQGQGRSLLAIVDQTGKENGLGGAITRMQPEGDNTVRIWLEQADFVAVLRWLALLENSYGVAVVEAAIDREAQPGLVRARLGLVRGAP
jgi:general secretion pathway protein M